MDYTIELNNIRKDDVMSNDKIKKGSIVSEVFTKMAQGKEIGNITGADKAVAYIKEIAQKAENGDQQAVSELNAMRKFALEPVLLQEAKLLQIFGNYQALGFGESIEAEGYSHENVRAVEQALGLDVPFANIETYSYPVGTKTISGGYAIDYRQLSLGNMQKENEGMEQVRIAMRNKAVMYCYLTIYNAIKNATGVKYHAENAGLTKASLDDIIKKVRRFGRPTLLGDYAVLSKINEFAGYAQTLNGKDIIGISDEILNTMHKDGLLGSYMGAPLQEIPNGYDLTKLNKAGDNFLTVTPQSLLYVIPSGLNSPVRTWTRGGITSMTGNDVTTGKIMTRFDLEIACDVAKGKEYQLGIIKDTSVEDII